MTYGYCRVSTKHQSLQRQINALVDYGINERFIFSDKYTGKTLDRNGLNDLLSIIKQGDTRVVKKTID
ncbi:recombinase family protein [Clostridioides sp. ES-S-0123-01]|uniref:recombinase family protein n=1 Tax=Clostridioides sp. ES-S-0123-01 TaxID=2770783 RepID=UPI001D110CD7|nr:recombinase family protein [Clostridioides sp. ES-S-0123-01]